MSWLVTKLLVLLNVVAQVGTDALVYPLIYPFVSSLQTTSPPLEGLEGDLLVVFRWTDEGVCPYFVTYFKVE